MLLNLFKSKSQRLAEKREKIEQSGNYRVVQQGNLYSYQIKRLSLYTSEVTWKTGSLFSTDIEEIYNQIIFNIESENKS